MVSKVSTEFRKYIRNCYELRRVLLKTQQSLDEISSANLFPGENLRETFLNRISVATLQKLLESIPALLVFGQSCHAKSVFINSFIGEPILPLHSSNWRWVRLLYSRTKRIRLTLGSEFEIVEPLEAQEHAWTSIPEADLRQSAFEENHDSTVALSTMLEVELPYPMLRDNIQIYVPPACPCDLLPQTLDKGLDRVLPVIFYVIETDMLNEENILELRKLKEIYPDLSIMFIKIDDTFNQSEVTNGSIKNISEENLDNLRRQLESLDFINVSESLCRETLDTKKSCFNHVSTSFLTSCYDIEESTSTFVRTCLQLQLIQASAFLSEVHNNCLRTFILSAFDMAREIQITPRRLQYAQQREAELYKTLMDIASMKQEEISRLIQLTLQDMKAHISDIIEECTKQDEKASPKSIKMATAEIQQLVLRKLSNSVATELVKSVDCFQESFTGTLQRCLLSLEKNCDEREDSLLASDAVKQILNAAYNVDLKSPTSFSLVHTFLERLRKLLHGFQLPWASSTQMHLNIEWRKQVANDMIDSLTAYRLARTICIQFQERVRASHDSFVLAMKSLENHYSGKLVQTEEQRVAIRKHYAPHLARLALDSTSMCDLVRWGIPQQGKEIGRGQYGVVFACQPWAGVDPCAVKSVVPPDERHWNDLAMEFYYTRTIPEHPRIVRLRGSIVDHSYGAGCSPAVLLIMERMVRDLYYGLRAGLPWKTRLQISIDVVEGIRYLHSQGLVHRDIKLKNVLLDCDNRAKLTDLGFCIPEAMMSGSVVGTPVHMAPELLSGHYDSSVDVYAFGILFWYVCAGHVRLPYVFEQFQNKEQLWNNVKKGIRPERLSDFDDSCWNLMQQCWSGEPSQRPLLGDVQPQLETIMNSISDGD